MQARPLKRVSWRAIASVRYDQTTLLFVGPLTASRETCVKVSRVEVDHLGWQPNSWAAYSVRLDFLPWDLPIQLNVNSTACVDHL